MQILSPSKVDIGSLRPTIAPAGLAVAPQASRVAMGSLKTPSLSQ